MPSYDIRHYKLMISNFVTHKMDASEFESTYLDTYKNDETRRSESEYALLNGLFLDIDAYCPDPSLRDSDDIDEETLRIRAGNTLAYLDKLSESTR